MANYSDCKSTTLAALAAIDPDTVLAVYNRYCGLLPDYYTHKVCENTPEGMASLFDGKSVMEIVDIVRDSNQYAYDSVCDAYIWLDDGHLKGDESFTDPLAEALDYADFRKAFCADIVPYLCEVTLDPDEEQEVTDFINWVD